MADSRDGYGFDSPDADRFTVEPVVPEKTDERLTDSSMMMLDIPSHFGRKLTTEVETGTTLYRLIQLF